MLGLAHHAHRDLDNNGLAGSIPDSIGNLTQLTYLCVACCALACIVVWAHELIGSEGGAMRVGMRAHGSCGLLSVANWALLTRTHATLGPVYHAHRYLSGNQLSGIIPDSVGSLTKLIYLCDSGCMLVWVHGQCGCGR